MTTAEVSLSESCTSQVGKEHKTKSVSHTHTPHRSIFYRSILSCSILGGAEQQNKWKIAIAITEFVINFKLQPTNTCDGQGERDKKKDREAHSKVRANLIQ